MDRGERALALVPTAAGYVVRLSVTAFAGMALIAGGLAIVDGRLRKWLRPVRFFGHSQAARRVGRSR